MNARDHMYERMNGELARFFLVCILCVYVQQFEFA